MSYVIQIVGSSSDLWPEHEHVFVKHYDPDGMEGRGAVVFCRDVEDALTYRSMSDALAEYRRVSTVQPLRMDGQLNRPLTAYSISIQPTEKMRSSR